MPDSLESIEVPESVIPGFQVFQVAGSAATRIDSEEH